MSREILERPERGPRPWGGWVGDKVLTYTFYRIRARRLHLRLDAPTYLLRHFLRRFVGLPPLVPSENSSLWL